MSGEPATSATPKPAESPRGGRRASIARLAIYLGLVAAIGAAVWFAYGRKIWSDYQDLRREVVASEDSAPVGYIGLNYRRSYNDRPLNFESRKDGRTLLFAAKGADGTTDYYDVTDSTLEPQRLAGGYGRDSIPGVDCPILDASDSSRAKSLRGRQEVFGVVLDDGPRAYPKDLLEKIEVANDLDGSTPFAVVYDRSRGRALLVDRNQGGAVVTFGTTGYSLDKRPLLYDRKSKSLWLPEGDGLACVSGASKGATAKAYRPAEAGPWSGWIGRHPKTTVLMGNDRKPPIPEE